MQTIVSIKWFTPTKDICTFKPQHASGNIYMTICNTVLEIFLLVKTSA